MPKLGVNIDHVATLRQARGEREPNPIEAARVCERAGADSIIAHLREDRRHIQEKDIHLLRKAVGTRLNLEMSLDEGIVAIALSLGPDQATIVPERRSEITTEGGLDVLRHFRRIRRVADALRRKGILVSLFVDPLPAHISKTKDAGVDMVELHTGSYALATSASRKRQALNTLKQMTAFAHRIGLTVNAGHGLKYHNVRPVARIPGIEELNIGHAIISRAVFVGLEQAAREMVRIVQWS